MKYKPIKLLTEFQECVLFNNWLELHPKIKEMTTHIPNELCKAKHDAINMKKQGMSPGFPDYAILIPGNHYKGLFIEMKRADRKNHKMPDNQVAWLERLNSHGYMAKFAFGFDDARDIVLSYIDDTQLKSLIR